MYAEVGDFIARHCHVLILLWDGSDNKKVGGTAWVKKRREHWVTAASSPSRGMVPPCVRSHDSGRNSAGVRALAPSTTGDDGRTATERGEVCHYLGKPDE